MPIYCTRAQKCTVHRLYITIFQITFAATQLKTIYETLIAPIHAIDHCGMF